MKYTKRVVSFALVFCLLLSLIPNVFAAETPTTETGFDFDASDYTVLEDGTLTVTVKRNDAGTGAAIITFHAADLLSEYGTDFVILDADGNELPRVEGRKPDPSDITEADDESLFSGISIADNLTAAPTERNSNLLGAVGTLLGTDDPAEEDHGQEGVTALETLRDWVIAAQGAVGTLSFAAGETEKTITVRPIDNSVSDGTRLFLLALTDVESDDVNAIIAPNATTYVNLIDDEESVISYTFNETAVTLTSETPEADLTIRRTAGTEYFSSVYVSSVSSTAPDGSYEAFRLKEVSFIPGETEKTVTVRALDFSEGGSFGVRLEAENAEFDRSYVSIAIEKDPLLPEETPSETALLTAGSGSILGNRYSYINGSSGSDKTSLSSFDNIANWSLYRSGYAALYCSSLMTMGTLDMSGLPQRFTLLTSNGLSAIRTTNKTSFAGIRAVHFDAALEGSSTDPGTQWGLTVSELPYGDSNYSSKGIYASTTSPASKTVSGYSLGESIFYPERFYTNKICACLTSGAELPRGEHTIRDLVRFAYTLNTASFNGSAYLNVYGGASNPIELFGLGLEHTLYKFLPQNSVDTFTRKLYDFDSTAGSGSFYSQTIYFDGESDHNYRPSQVSVTYNGSSVDGFYSNANKNVVIAPSEPEKIAANGLILKGVYFAAASADAGTVPGSAEAGKTVAKMLYVPADHGEIILSVNTDFVSQLINAGVVSAANPEEESVQIFPVYEREYVSAVFTKSADGVSEFFNLDDWWVKEGSLTAADGDKLYQIENYNGTDETVYAMNVEKASVIRVCCHIASGAAADGVSYASASAPTDVSITYHKAGNYKASAVTAQGILIPEDDFSKADVDMQDSYVLCPAIGEQYISIRYFDQYDDGVLVPDEFRPEDLSRMVGYLDSSVSYDELTGKVTDIETGEDITDTYTGISGADGIVTVEVLTGGMYSFFVVPPAGYSVQWTNMTGDANHDGVIDGEAEENAHNRHSNSVNPDYLIGNRLNIVVDQDNIQYYYQFIPLSSDLTGTKSGTLVRENKTFYELANGLTNLSTTPCIGAQVYLADWNGATNAAGKYSIQVGSLPKSGSMSASAIVNGTTYNFDVPCQYNNAKITLPAMYRFTAESLKAWYGDANNEADCSGAIIVKDDTLTIKAEVGNCGTIRPADARFEVRRNDMNVYTFSEEEVTFQPGIQSGTAILTFNPLEILESGDRIWVSFRDESGSWYPYVDLGITFLSELKLGRIFLPLFGASLAAGDATDDTFEVIGSALCDLAMDALGDLETSEPRLTYPTGVSVEDHSLSWYETDYSYSFDTDLLPKFGKDGDEKDKKSDEENNEDMKEEAEELKKDDTKVDDNSKGKLKTSSSYIWNVNIGVGFRLTISQRMDDAGEFKNYFEDMAFYVKVGTTANASVDVALPIGISILFRFDLDLKAVVIYRLYNNYNIDPYHINGTIPYDDFDILSSDSKISRQGYIFIDPTIKVTLGVKVGILTVSGKATFIIDMDFCVGEDSDNYGRLDIDLGWGIKILGFEVYSKDTNVAGVKLFGDDAFDYDAGQAAVQLAADAFSYSDGTFSLNTPTDRSYLNNRTEWNSAGIRLLGSSAAGSDVKTLMRGTVEDPYTTITDFGNGKVLLVFVGDDINRPDSVNKRAVFYSSSEDNGSTWSEPVLIDNDSTLDDYPDVFDLGNGQALVTWSSVDEILPDGATLETALKQLNLKAAFYDVDTGTFGSITKLTKTTRDDFCADVLPHAAYDSATGRIILYYTKTEYSGITDADDIGSAESVTAYLFCENEDGEWVWQNTAAAYSDTEIAAAADPDDYRTQWYGQRFLDPRIDKSSSAMPLIVSSDAIYYNGLSIYSWIADWDNDPNTTEDRDVFMQTYNFEENRFSYSFRITENSGTYTLPRLLHTDDGILMFYGALVKEEATDESGEGEIRYVNLSDVIREDKYTLRQNGNVKYYELSYAKTVELRDGGTETYEVWVPAEVIRSCGNIEDYSVAADSLGQLYLLWTDSDDNGRQIYASMRAEGRTDWSLPCALTCGEDLCYSDVNCAILNGEICIVSGQINTQDSSNTALVILNHQPGSSVVLEDLSISDRYPMPGENVMVTAKLTNKGLLPVSGSYEITFALNGVNTTTEVSGDFIGGGSLLAVENLTVPESFDALEYSAVMNGATVSLSCEPGPVLNFAGDAFSGGAYTVEIMNEGNMEGHAELVVNVGEKVVGTLNLTGIRPGESATVSVPVTLADSDYTIDSGSDIAHADMMLIVSDGESELYTGTASAQRIFASAAVEALRNLDIGSLSGQASAGEPVEIIPSAAAADSLRILWTASSDPDIVTVNSDGTAEAIADGTATLTGRIVPADARVVIGQDGISYILDPAELIPDELQKTVTASVTVGSVISEPEEEEGRTTDAENLIFVDVPENAFFYDAVYWAAEKDIITGVDDTHFVPDDDATRAQMVCILWRAAGSPVVEKDNPFVDVDPDAYYADAVCWAFREGLIKGTSSTTFSPDDVCSRAQAVTLLWRFAGSSPAAESSPFIDVPRDTYYTEAVNWANTKDVVKGTSSTTFSPDDVCSRAQAVTLLWRWMMGIQDQ